MRKLDFKCPKCGKKRKLEEVLAGATVCSAINSFSEDGDVDYLSFGSDIHDGEIARFQCAICGFIIRHDDGSNDIVNNYEDLYFLAAKKGWIGESTT